VKKRLSNRIFSTTILSIILFVILVPILWLIATSLKSTRDVITFPPQIFFRPTLENYVGLQRIGFFESLTHSLIIGISTSVLTFILGAPFAYIIARYSFRKPETSNNIRFWILSLRLMPPIVVIIPFIFFWYRLQLLDTYVAIIITNLTYSLPLFIWLAIDAYSTVPPQVEEASFLEGCGLFRTFFMISLPIALRGLLSVLIFTFLFVWNEFFLVFALTSQLQTLPLLLSSQSAAAYTAPWGTVSALTVVLSVPSMVLVFFLFRFMKRYFVVNV
jgi:multiple sugar transport system permease protein